MGLLAGSALLETGCTASEITQAIDIAQIAISGIVTGLTVTGTIPAGLQPTILGWAQQATNFVGQTITELSSKDTDVVKAEVITQQVTAVVTTYKNLSQQAQTLVEVAEQDVESILNLVSNSATPLVVSHGVAKRRGVTVHMLDVANRTKLAQIKTRNDADVQKLKSFSAAHGASLPRP